MQRKSLAPSVQLKSLESVDCNTFPGQQAQRGALTSSITALTRHEVICKFGPHQCRRLHSASKTEKYQDAADWKLHTAKFPSAEIAGVKVYTFSL